KGVGGSGLLAKEQFSLSHSGQGFRGKSVAGAAAEGGYNLVVVAAEIPPVLLHFREQLLYRDARRDIPVGAEDDLLHTIAEDLRAVGVFVRPAVDDAHRLHVEII